MSYSNIRGHIFMKYLLGLDLKTILYLLLAVIIIIGIVKKLFKLVIVIAVAGILFYLFGIMY